MRFHVTFPNGESLNVELTSKELKGSCLLHKVHTHLSLSDDAKKYFALSYSDKYDGGKNWIQAGDNLKKIKGVKSANSLLLQFEIHIFPKNPHLAFTSPQSLSLARQYLKSLLVRDLMKYPDMECAAVLDALIAQSELGNHEDVKRDYAQLVSTLDVYLPTSITFKSTVTENYQYMKKVELYHRMFHDMSPVEADAMFLSKARNMPNYGYTFHKISDSLRKQYLLALSPHGIHFIYDTTLGKEIPREKQETFDWDNFIGCSQTNQKEFKMKLFVTDSTATTRKFKIKSCRDAARFMWDMKKYRKVISYDFGSTKIQIDNNKICNGNGHLPSNPLLIETVYEG